MTCNVFVSLFAAWLQYNWYTWSCAHLKRTFEWVLFLSFKMYLFLAVLGLHCCEGFFSWCSNRGLLSSGAARDSAVTAHGLCSCGSWTWEHRLSHVAHWLSCSTAWGIFSDQGLNSCIPHWQEGSLSLNHQGSPWMHFYTCETISTIKIMSVHHPQSFFTAHKLKVKPVEIIRKFSFSP